MGIYEASGRGEWEGGGGEGRRGVTFVSVVVLILFNSTTQKYLLVHQC